LPEADDHPFWVALDAIGDGLSDLRRASGADLIRAEGTMTVSSDAPAGWHYCWIDLPAAPGLHNQMLALALEGFSRARLALPDANWEIKLEDRPMQWAGNHFAPPA
jgi:hypothetical protein